MPLLGLKPFPEGCPHVPILGCCNVRDVLLLGYYRAHSASQVHDTHALATVLAPRSAKTEKPPPMLAHRFEQRNRKSPKTLCHGTGVVEQPSRWTRSLRGIKALLSIVLLLLCPLFGLTLDVREILPVCLCADKAKERC